MTGMVIVLNYCILECFTLKIKVMAFKATMNFLGMKHHVLYYASFLKNSLPSGNSVRFLVLR
jgi:hypothetical protein